MGISLFVSLPSPHSLSLTPSRRRADRHDEPHQMAHRRRFPLHTTRLELRSSNLVLLRQHGFRHGAQEHDQRDPARIPDHRSQQGPLPWIVLLPRSSAAKERLRPDRRQCDAAGYSGCASWGQSLQRMLPLSLLPPGRIMRERWLTEQCADITFVERGQEDPMPEGMCTNSSTIGFNLVYSTTSDAFRAAVVLPSVIGFVTVLSVLAQRII